MKKFEIMYSDGTTKYICEINAEFYSASNANVIDFYIEHKIIATFSTYSLIYIIEMT